MIWELILFQHFSEFLIIHQRHDSYTRKYVSIRKRIHVVFINADLETFNFRSKSGYCVIFNFFLKLWMNCLDSRAYGLNSRAMQTIITHARHWVSMLRVHVGVACCIIHQTIAVSPDYLKFTGISTLNFFSDHFLQTSMRTFRWRRVYWFLYRWLHVNYVLRKFKCLPALRSERRRKKVKLHSFALNAFVLAAAFHLLWNIQCQNVTKQQK